MAIPTALEIQENIAHNTGEIPQLISDPSTWPIMQRGMEIWEQQIIDTNAIFQVAQEKLTPTMTKTTPRQAMVQEVTISAKVL